ncbi:hypothetical protein CHARACLAT_017977, partial [Characodon lateralis]|nr:hypothetical protein [Characodon lateralis]
LGDCVFAGASLEHRLRLRGLGETLSNAPYLHRFRRRSSIGSEPLRLDSRETIGRKLIDSRQKDLQTNCIMSLRVKQNRRARLCAASEGFSTKSMGSYPVLKASTTNNVVPIKPLNINKNLLTPVKVDIDSAAQALRIQEKDQIRDLNNRFASYIQKVQLLEQQKKILETKWQLLQEPTITSSDTEPVYKAFIANLEKQLDLAHKDKERLEGEQRAAFSQLDSYHSKYEEEFNRRFSAENHFVENKKDLDAGYIAKVELETMLSGLEEDVKFLSVVYDVEMREVQGSLKETSVVVEMDNSRSLNMDHVLSDVKAQYEEIAALSREETENWYKTKFYMMTFQAKQSESELSSTKREIAELKRRISHLQHDIDTLKLHRETLQSSITEVDTRGQKAMLDANVRIKVLKQALMESKHLMAKQIKEYQDLMNIKLGLDIEISTYKKLMEGEEERLGQQNFATIHSVPISRNVSPAPSNNNHQRPRSGPVLIKTVETKKISYS